MENRGKREGNYQVLDELGTLLITNFPSRSVVVPIDVPLTKTDAPMTGWLSSSEKTTPITFLVVAVTNSSKHDFNRCKSVTCRFLSRDTKSARDKNGTKPRKNKVKNTSLEISLVEYLCFVCKGTNLSLEKRGEIPISLIHNSFSYHCTTNVVIANGFDLKRHDLRKSGVKFCFALCWTFSKIRTGNRTKDLPPLLSNPWFCECLNDRHLKMLNFK